MMRMRSWLAMALLSAGFAGTSRADEFAIQSFSGTGQLVFNTLNSATNYRVEWASTPAGPWTNFIGATLARLDNIPAGGYGSLTCSVPMFYRVVAAVTNAWLVIEAEGNLTFGAVDVGSTDTRTLTLRNRGGAPMTVSGITYPDGFSGDWAGVIPPGFEQDVTVTFTPTQIAAYGGTVVVHSDSANGNNTLSIAGSGITEYLVVDVSDGPSAASYPVSYAAAPGGGWSDTYKTTRIVLRRIPATTPAFTMGAPIGELGRQTDEVQHQVTLSQEFYICVFEVTQRQWERVMGTWPSWFNNASYRDARPVEMVSYDFIRGSSAGAGWPGTSAVDTTSFMGKLRAKTGRAFDLPTESQWEYACRAGTATALNSGYNLTNTTTDARVAEVGRHNYIGGSGVSQGGDTGVGTAKAGSYLPNAWGLYDMHGNVWEWCLDWSGVYPGAVSDPKGALSGGFRVFRGGCWNGPAYHCRSAIHGCYEPYRIDYNVGFRAVIVLSD